MSHVWDSNIDAIACSVSIFEVQAVSDGAQVSMSHDSDFISQHVWK